MDKQEPYYTVIFTSIRTGDHSAYFEMDKKLSDLVKEQPGFLGMDSYSNETGQNVTIANFKTLEDLKNWKENPLHMEAQQKGRAHWYAYYNVKVCKVEREYEFNKK